MLQAHHLMLPMFHLYQLCVLRPTKVDLFLFHTPTIHASAGDLQQWSSVLQSHYHQQGPYVDLITTYHNCSISKKSF